MALRRLESLTTHFPNITMLHTRLAQCLVYMGKNQEGLLGLQAHVRTLKEGPAKREGEQALEEFRAFLKRHNRGYWHGS